MGIFSSLSWPFLFYFFPPPPSFQTEGPPHSFRTWSVLLKAGLALSFPKSRARFLRERRRRDKAIPSSSIGWTFARLTEQSINQSFIATHHTTSPHCLRAPKAEEVSTSSAALPINKMAPPPCCSYLISAKSLQVSPW